MWSSSARSRTAPVVAEAAFHAFAEAVRGVGGKAGGAGRHPAGAGVVCRSPLLAGVLALADGGAAPSAKGAAGVLVGAEVSHLFTDSPQKVDALAPADTAVFAAGRVAGCAVSSELGQHMAYPLDARTVTNAGIAVVSS